MLYNSSIDGFLLNKVIIQSFILSCKIFYFDWLRQICYEKRRNVDDGAFNIQHNMINIDYTR